MLFNLTHKLPDHCFVAVSGGVDSMSALHWLASGNKNRVAGVVYISHGTAYSWEASSAVRKYFSQLREENKLHLTTILKGHSIDDLPGPGESVENFWRDKRYEYFRIASLPVVLAHNFDDCVEEYIMCTMVRGREGTIPYQHGNCIRPFRLWKKASICAYAKRHKIPYVEDPSNVDVSFKRNFIRHLIAPKVVELNPGIYKIVGKMIEKQDKFDKNEGIL